MKTNHIYQGDSLDVLKTFPDKSIDCCITSPPYYGLRDYGTGKWVGGDPNCPHRRTSKFSEKTITGHAQKELAGNVGDAIYKTICPLCGAVREDKQIGLEETPEEYIQRLVGVFREIKRVLKDDGTLWLNIGDSYYSNTSTNRNFINDGGRGGNNPNNKSYERYGGRGISVCQEWNDSFVPFYQWSIENGYKEDISDSGRNRLSIDRIDNDGNYEPSNCRWTTNDVQANNKRKSLPKEIKYVNCPICGKQYIKTQRKGAKTCSMECGMKLRSIMHPNTKDYTKICPVCKKTFNAKRGGHFNDAVCCSRKCAYLLKSPVWQYNGESHRVPEWSEIIGINTHCLYHRKEMGWSVQEILTTPLRGKRNATKL